MVFRDYNPGKIIEVFAICYNEEFMLPHFIKHYREHFNATITIFDNHSTDKSAQIIQDLGCKLKTYDSGGKIRDDYYLNIKNNCWRQSGANFVIVCDIDEFLEVNFVLNKECTIINTKGFDVVGGVDSRLGVPNSLFSKHVMFDPINITDIRYRPGCHRCEPMGISVVGSKKIATLLHRKYISEEYLFKKHSEYQKRLSEFNKKHKFGAEYENVSMDAIKANFENLRKNAILIP